MRSHTAYLTFETAERREFVRITDDVQEAVAASGVAEGMVLVSAMHITAGVWVNDDEPGILEDTLEWLDKLAPPSWKEPANDVARALGPDPGDFRHHRGGEDNGDAHWKNLLVHHQVGPAKKMATRTGRTCSPTIRSSCRSPMAGSTWGRGRPSSTPSSTGGGASGSSSRCSGSRYSAPDSEHSTEGAHMAIADRTANTVWEGGLAKGNGTLSLKSGATDDLSVTWASRTERSDGKTSPEELVAAAHASCFAMALSHELGEAGHEPERLEVSSVVTLDEVDGAPTVTTSKLTVRGRVPGIDQDEFEKAAQGAGKNCPISRALGGVDISVDAQLEDGGSGSDDGS